MARSIIKKENITCIEYNFNTNPNNYLKGGYILASTYGNICVLTVTDLQIKNSPLDDTILATGLPEALHRTSTVLNGITSYGVQKIRINGTNLTNMYTTDAMRNNTQYVSGQLIYICK